MSDLECPTCKGSALVSEGADGERQYTSIEAGVTREAFRHLADERRKIVQLARDRDHSIVDARLYRIALERMCNASSALELDAARIQAAEVLTMEEPGAKLTMVLDQARRVFECFDRYTTETFVIGSGARERAYIALHQACTALGRALFEAHIPVEISDD